MNKAVFLDRDGTINKDVHHLHRVDQLRLLPGVAEAVTRLNKLGFLTIIITNQSVVARGMITEKELENVHGVLLKRLAKQGARIDAIYYCPHHPGGTIKDYSVHCTCRKPEADMLIRAIKDLKINPQESYMVGDSTGDILAGQKAGVKTILVKTGYGGSDGKHEATPDFTVRNLPAAVDLIQTHGQHSK